VTFHVERVCLFCCRLCCVCVCVCACVLFIAPCITRLISFFFSLPHSCRSIACSSGGQTQSDIADRTSRHLNGAAAASVVTNRPAESILSLSSMTSLSLLAQIPGSSCRNICGYCEFRCVFRQMFSKFYFPVSFLYLSGSMHVKNGVSVTYEPIIMCDVVFCKRLDHAPTTNYTWSFWTRTTTQTQAKYFIRKDEFTAHTCSTLQLHYTYGIRSDVLPELDMLGRRLFLQDWSNHMHGRRAIRSLVRARKHVTTRNVHTD